MIFIIDMKKCSNCHQEKPNTEFYKPKHGQCKECIKLKNKKRNKKRYQEDINYRETLVSSSKQWKKDNPKKWKEYKEKTKEYRYFQAKIYREDNKEYLKEYQKDYYKQNKEILFQKIKEYEKQNPHIRRWRNLLSNTINFNKTDSTKELLGYTYNELKEHLDNQGMDWNYHHIDHKIPYSWFKENTPPHIVNDLRNLHPLDPKVNQSKSNTYHHQIPNEYLQIILEYLKEDYIFIDTIINYENEL